MNETHVTEGSDSLPVGTGDSGTLDGTQAIRRAVAILRLVAGHRSPGASLANICESAQLPRSTTHRILKCLVSEGLLEMDDNDGRYTIGPLASELSLVGLNDHHASSFWSGLPPRVARRTGHTSYLLARTGREAVCLQRAEGHALYRVSPVEVGQRRPLGVGAGAIALLASFGKEDIEAFTQSLTLALRPFKNLSPEMVLADVMEAKQKGYSLSVAHVFAGTVGIGIALPGDSPAKLAVSITSPAQYVEEVGVNKIVDMIRNEIEMMQQ